MAVIMYFRDENGLQTRKVEAHAAQSHVRSGWVFKKSELYPEPIKEPVVEEKQEPEVEKLIEPEKQEEIKKEPVKKPRKRGRKPKKVKDVN